MITCKILLFLIKKFFSEKLVFWQKREHNFRILMFLVPPTFFIPPLPLSVTHFVLYAFPADPCFGIRGVS